VLVGGFGERMKGGTYEGELYGTTETGCCGFIFGGPAVMTDVGEGELGGGGGRGHCFVNVQLVFGVVV
jgi:hypothetical protein